MTNPFATATAVADGTTSAALEASMLAAKERAAAAIDSTPAAPPTTVTTDKPSDAPKNFGIGDPFAAPKGIGDGERITDFVDRLLLIKPTEFIEKMQTTQGPSDAVRVDMAVLDDPVEPGKIIIGVLLFQQALKREAKAILEGDLPYLLGRLNKGITGNNNTLYTFLEASPAEADIAREWLRLGGKL